MYHRVHNRPSLALDRHFRCTSGSRVVIRILAGNHRKTSHFYILFLLRAGEIRTRATRVAPIRRRAPRNRCHGRAGRYCGPTVVPASGFHCTEAISVPVSAEWASAQPLVIRWMFFGRLDATRNLAKLRLLATCPPTRRISVGRDAKGAERWCHRVSRSVGAGWLPRCC